MTEDFKNLTNRCLVVSKSDDQVKRKIVDKPVGTQGKDQIRVQIQYSSLNFKDALCANAHPGIAKTLPLIPGIDAAGVVINDPSGQFVAGDEVMIFHAEFGTLRDGGYCQVVDADRQWVYPIPPGLSPRTCMILGTAGFTAAQSIDELIKHDIKPESGDIVVTGATGGVGICAVNILAGLGYNVFAVTGKADRESWLKEMGAHAVIGREEVSDDSKKPLLQGRWAGAVDTVGGNILATILRSTKPRGCVTACGLVAGTDFGISVYPFILRSVTLQGIDTAGISREYRAALWEKLASDWAIGHLERLAIETDLNGLDAKIQSILDGQIAGRVIVKMH